MIHEWVAGDDMSSQFSKPDISLITVFVRALKATRSDAISKSVNRSFGGQLMVVSHVSIHLCAPGKPPEAVVCFADYGLRSLPEEFSDF